MQVLRILPSFVFKLKTTFPVRYDYIQRPPEKCHSRKRSASGILLNTGIFGQNNKERFRTSRNDTLLLEMFSPTFLRMNLNISQQKYSRRTLQRRKDWSNFMNRAILS